MLFPAFKYDFLFYSLRSHFFLNCGITLFTIVYFVSISLNDAYFKSSKKAVTRNFGKVKRVC